MRNLLIVPLFILLVSLIPSGYAIGGLSTVKSNTYLVTCSGIGEVTGVATITLNKDGQLLNSTIGRCSTLLKAVAPSPLLLTNVSPNGYQISITGKANEGGTLSSQTCSLQGSTTPNVPVPVQCTIPNSHAVVFVTITTA